LASDVVLVAAVCFVVDVDELASLLELQTVPAERLASNGDLVLGVRAIRDARWRGRIGLGNGLA